MSRRPPSAPVAPNGYFILTAWRPVTDAGARAIRARWRASLAVLGVRTLEVESGGLVALWREGEEAASNEAQRQRAYRRTKRTAGRL